jgi:serine protease Do
MSKDKLNNGFFKGLKEFFKKPYVKTVSLIIITVTLSTVINSYYRNIQESIHDGIVKLHDVNPTIAEGLYEINGFILNGKNFDQERKAKRTIYEAFGSVVVVNAFAPKNPELNGLSGRGTGFMIAVDETSATIITNHHVVDAVLDQPDVFELFVQTAGSMWKYTDVEIIGFDPVTDIAVIKIFKQDNEEWEAVDFATDEDYSTGTPVVVIGHGMGMLWNATQGHVTYKDRYGLRPYNLMLQVDAVINQGNSGGPVFNLAGDVIGVAQSIYSPGRQVPGWDGVGIAVSVNQVKRSVDFILSPEYIAKGYVPYIEFPFALGSFELEVVKDIPKEDRHYAYFDYPPIGPPVAGQTEEARVKTVGELSGLLQGDILIEVNGESIPSSFKILRMTLKAFPGDIWTVKVLRGEEEVIVDIAMRELDIKPLYEALSRQKAAQK